MCGDEMGIDWHCGRLLLPMQIFLRKEGILKEERGGREKCSKEYERLCVAVALGWIQTKAMYTFAV